MFSLPLAWAIGPFLVPALKALGSMLISSLLVSAGQKAAGKLAGSALARTLSRVPGAVGFGRAVGSVAPFAAFSVGDLLMEGLTGGGGAVARGVRTPTENAMLANLMMGQLGNQSLSVPFIPAGGQPTGQLGNPPLPLIPADNPTMGGSIYG